MMVANDDKHWHMKAKVNVCMAFDDRALIQLEVLVLDQIDGDMSSKE